MGFFRAHALAWAAKARGEDQKFNVIAARNAYVERVAKDQTNVRQVLDVGCGSGDLCCTLAGMGYETVGVDFAQEMIDQCRRNAEAVAGPAPKFHCASIFEFEMAPGAYDLISANGFIEYISVADLKRFLRATREALSPNGSLVVGSRNRLFNIFSRNAFTESELRQATANLLLAECVAISRGIGFEDLATLATPPLPSDEATYERTGIEVSTRHQYTPAQLIKLVVEAGFEPKHLGAIHIHGVPPQTKDVLPQAHVASAEFLDQFKNDHPALIPQASSFMLHAVRA